MGRAAEAVSRRGSGPNRRFRLAALAGLSWRLPQPHPTRNGCSQQRADVCDWNIGSHGDGKMEAIVLGDDDLRRLETRFGPVVRQMGPWNSDGVFGYCSVPISAVEEAIES